MIRPDEKYSYKVLYLTGGEYGFYVATNASYFSWETAREVATTEFPKTTTFIVPVWKVHRALKVLNKSMTDQEKAKAFDEIIGLHIKAIDGDDFAAKASTLLSKLGKNHNDVDPAEGRIGEPKDFPDESEAILRRIDNYTIDRRCVGRLIKIRILRHGTEDEDGVSRPYMDVTQTDGETFRAYLPCEEIYTPNEHAEVLVFNQLQAWWRTECTCGHRGVWLRDRDKCLPCSRFTNAGREAAEMRPRTEGR